MRTIAVLVFCAITLVMAGCSKETSESMKSDVNKMAQEVDRAFEN